jgi:hypothetical protein
VPRQIRYKLTLSKLSEEGCTSIYSVVNSLPFSYALLQTMKLLLFILPVAFILAWGGVLLRTQRTVEPGVTDKSLVVQDRYLVSLEIGHTLDEHWKTIGQNLSKDGEDFRYMDLINVYVVTLRNASIVHNTIRLDPQVEDVESMSPKLFHFPLSYVHSRFDDHESKI